MAFQDTYKVAFQDESGRYYYGQLLQDATYLIGTNGTLTYLNNIPIGWDTMAIQWERDNHWGGVFRSMSTKNFKFALDGRAIIQHIKKTKGMKGYCKMTIYTFNNATFSYDVWYQSYMDFTTYKDDIQVQQLEISTLDSGLIRMLHAYANTKFNLPVWTYDQFTNAWFLDGYPDSSGYNNAVFVVHDGIKLMYQANYNSAASKEHPLVYYNIVVNKILGFNQGRHGSGPDKGVHTIPNLNPFNITQNNGSTTFIGNDILATQVIQKSQAPLAVLLNEEDFSGDNNSQPYSRDNYILRSFQGIIVNVSISITFAEHSVISHNDNGNGSFIGFALFEIDKDNNPIIPSSGDLENRYTYWSIYEYPLAPASSTLTVSAPSGTFGNFNSPVEVYINPNKVYIMGIIYDEPYSVVGGGLSGDGSKRLGFSLQDFTVQITSKCDYGYSGVPIPAPRLNPSVFPAFTINNIFARLIPFLDTVSTDGYGFPIPVPTDFRFESNFLNDPTVLVGDCCPKQILITSDYCIRDLQGRSYVTASVDQMFDFCKKILGCGASIDYDSSGNPTIFRVEDIAYFFDNTTMLFDFGYNVYGVTIEPLVEGLGANLKVGYAQQDLNSDFGVDIINTELYFNTPLSLIPGEMDYQSTGIETEINAIEKKRAQKVSQPIGENVVPGNPSNSNGTIALYCQPIPTVILYGNNPTYGALVPYNPANGVYPVFAYQLTQDPNAQSRYPTLDTYIFGTHYPDTVYNLELSPCRMLQRGSGRWLHSVLDLMEEDKLTFRNTYVMQYNNESTGLQGIESNLGSGVVTEFKDIPISSLPAPIFKPNIIRFKSDYPFNMYAILQGNNRGYIRLFVRGNGYGQDKEYRGFIRRVTQMANRSATEFELIGTPDVYGGD